MPLSQVGCSPGTDDGVRSTAAFVNNAVTLPVGDNGGTLVHAFFRFLPALPRNAAIRSAKLLLTTAVDWSANLATSQVRIPDAVDPAAPTALGALPAAWRPYPVGFTPKVAADTQVAADLSAPLQEAVRAYGWTDASPLLLYLVVPAGMTYPLSFHATEATTSSFRPVLKVVWDYANATAVRSPGVSVRTPLGNFALVRYRPYEAGKDAVTPPDRNLGHQSHDEQGAAYAPPKPGDDTPAASHTRPPSLSASRLERAEFVGTPVEPVGGPAESENVPRNTWVGVPRKIPAPLADSPSEIDPGGV